MTLLLLSHKVFAFSFFKEKKLEPSDHYAYSWLIGNGRGRERLTQTSRQKPMLFDGARLGKVARAPRKGGWLKFTPALIWTGGGGMARRQCLQGWFHGEIQKIGLSELLLQSRPFRKEPPFPSRCKRVSGQMSEPLRALGQVLCAGYNLCNQGCYHRCMAALRSTFFWLAHPEAAFVHVTSKSLSNGLPACPTGMWILRHKQLPEHSLGLVEKGTGTDCD